MSYLDRVKKFVTRPFFRSLYAPSSDFWFNTIAPTTKAGVKVNEQLALTYLTVYSCVSLISGDVARLPLKLYKKQKDDSREVAYNHPLYEKLHTLPNPETTSFDWRESKQLQMCLWGNTYSQIIRDGEGKILKLVLIPDPDAVKVERKNGEIVYIVTENSKEKTIKAENMLHIHGMGFNGLYGLSPVSIARQTIGLGLGAEDFAARFYSNGVMPSGIIQTERPLGENKEQFIKDFKRVHAGLGNAHSAMILNPGMTYKTVSMPLSDAQFLESRSFNKREIASIYHVPPHKLGMVEGNSSYNSLEQENQQYVNTCIVHWTTRWDQQLGRQLLTDKERGNGYYFEHDLKGLLRGDSKTRAEYYKTFFNMGYPLNKILRKENENPVEGGDVGYIQINMAPIDQISEIHEQPTPQAQPTPNNQPNTKKEEQKSFEYETRSLNSYLVNARSIRAEFRAKLLSIAQELMNEETESIQTALDKYTKPEERAEGNALQKWLDSFYDRHRPYVRDKFAPVVELFAKRIVESVGSAFDLEIGFDPSLERFMNDCLEKFAFRHCHKGRDELELILLDAKFKPSVFYPEITARIDEWKLKQAGKMADDFSVRLQNAVSMEAFASGGVSKKVWRITGKETCPFCTQLNGKVIGVRNNFLNAGDVMTAEPDKKITDPDDPKYGKGYSRLKVYGDKKHPPIHAGCDCIIAPG